MPCGAAYVMTKPLRAPLAAQRKTDYGQKETKVDWRARRSGAIEQGVLVVPRDEIPTRTLLRLQPGVVVAQRRQLLRDFRREPGPVTPEVHHQRGEPDESE